MALDADEWLDRQKLKQSLLKWRIAGLVLSALLVVAFIQPWEGLDGETDQPHVAVLELEGVLQEDPDLIEALDRAQNDDAVRALIVQINSPGSTFVGENPFMTRSGGWGRKSRLLPKWERLRPPGVTWSRWPRIGFLRAKDDHWVDRGDHANGEFA